MINITIGHGEKEFTECNNIWLDPNAPNTTRRFVLSGIRTKNTTVDSGSTVHISISLTNRLYSQFLYIEFDIYIYTFKLKSLPEGDEWQVTGNINNIGVEQYRQGVIDAFAIWQNEIAFDWFSLPINSQLKSDYITACILYSGLGTKIKEKDAYLFDFSIIKEVKDFYYIAGFELAGDRGYMGYDLFTFTDCLLELYKHNGYFNESKVIFLNTGAIHDPEIREMLVEWKNAFIRYGFSVQEKL